MQDETDLAPRATVHLPARDIALPAALSAEARRVLAISRPAPPRPALDDVEGWRGFVAARNAELASVLGPQTAGFDAEVTVRDIGGTSVYIGAPTHKAGEAALVHMRGGGLLLGGGEENMRFEAAAMAHRTGRIVFAIDYPVPPDHPYPAALDRCLDVYHVLLKERGAASLVVSGISAGGNLASATMLRASREKLAMPAGIILLSPEIDLTESGDSFESLMGLDNRLTYRLTEFNRLYAGTAALSDPLLSPLFGDLEGFPPAFVQSGTRDLFLSNAVRFHRALRDAGVRADLHVWDGMPHVGFGGSTPEDRAIFNEVREFLDGLARA